MSTFDPEPSLSTMCFSVSARAEPGVLPRLVELFAKRGLTPTHLRADWGDPAGSLLGVEIRMTGMDRELAVYIGQCMRGIMDVDDVLVSEPRHADVA